MKIKPLLLYSALTTLLCSCNSQNMSMDRLIERQLDSAAEQYEQLHHDLQENRLPRTINKETGDLVTSGSGWWCSGFFPGSLWYLYDHTGDASLKKMAMQRSNLVEKEKHNVHTHDLGFMLYNSLGNGLHIADVNDYKSALVTGAYSLSSRYNKTVECIRSWDHGDWTFPVIIDNMMNLEYLLWAFRETGDSAFHKIAISHADKTIEHHFRNDYSSFHLVDFDTITGEVIGKQTVQGYSDESAWARGQAWGFYGFVMMYRETGKERYLKQAVRIADFIIHHPNLPDDKIPYWDYDAPNIPEAKRDASAGAITCSALIELSDYVNPEMAAMFMEVAEQMLRTLSSPEYRAAMGENGNFLLKHSVGHLKAGSEVDVPLSYADYYYIEALMRMKERR